MADGPTQIPPGPRQCYNADEFMCNNRACIPPDYRCDGDYDCTDRSDEENCRGQFPHLLCPSCVFADSLFACAECVCVCVCVFDDLFSTFILSHICVLCISYYRLLS